jgi:hypothetical protein
VLAGIGAGDMAARLDGFCMVVIAEGLTFHTGQSVVPTTQRLAINPEEAGHSDRRLTLYVKAPGLEQPLEGLDGGPRPLPQACRPQTH